MLAGDVMTRKVISVASDASAMQAGTLMLKHQISGLPVVDFERNSCSGLLARATFCDGPNSERNAVGLGGWRF